MIDGGVQKFDADVNHSSKVIFCSQDRVHDLHHMLPAASCKDTLS